jgi:hypothetical protein
VQKGLLQVPERTLGLLQQPGQMNQHQQQQQLLQQWVSTKQHWQARQAQLLLPQLLQPQLWAQQQ